jgi:mannan endo-1,4-beta-mannosidase
LIPSFSEKKLLVYGSLALLVGAATFVIVRWHGRRPIRAGFVGVSGSRFVLDGRPFRFVGANVAVMYKDEDRQRMPETLRAAAADGIRVIRVWANGEGGPDDIKPVGADRSDWPRTHPFRWAPGNWNEDELIHLDHVLAEAPQDNLRVQLTLANWWRDTGGVTQYLYWAGVKDAADEHYPFGVNVDRAMLFYTNDEARRLYREHVEKIILRRNTVTGRLYRDDPTIMGYELVNEAQAPTGRWEERRAWFKEMSSFVKSLDPDHLITPGDWGFRSAVERREWLKDHALPNIDYCDVHNYPREDLDSFVDSPEALKSFIDNRAAAAFSINKPLVFGEFGMSRDGYKDSSQVEWLRAYFEGASRDAVAGAMFWIVTPDPDRGYGISYAAPGDNPAREQIGRGAQLFGSSQYAPPPRELLAGDHSVPHEVTRVESGPASQPLVSSGSDGALIYRFKPEGAKTARFEKLGSGEGYIWGFGAGYVEYVLPARDKWTRVAGIVVRAHLQPVLPADARPPNNGSRITLLVDGLDCGSRLVPVEEPVHALTQEWIIDSLRPRLRAALGRPITFQFAVKTDADQPYGLNISNYPEGYEAQGASPIEVEIRK